MDDTATTGTTLRRAAIALLDPHGGAAAVDVAVVARTPRDNQDYSDALAASCGLAAEKSRS